MDFILTIWWFVSFLNVGTNPAARWLVPEIMTSKVSFKPKIYVARSSIDENFFG